MASTISIIGSITRKHLLLTLTLVELFIGLPVCLISMQTYISHDTFLLSNQQALTIVSARGETLTFGIRVENSLDGEWASPQGLSLQLDGLSSPLTVIAPQTQDWGSTISSSISQENNPFVISRNVTIPPSISDPERRPLSGVISGTLIYPESAGCPPQTAFNSHPGGCFQSHSTTIDIPVQLQLVSPGEFLWSSGKIAFYIFATLESLCSVALILSSLLILFRALRASIRQGRSYSSPLSGCLTFLAFPFSGLIAFICYSLLAPPVVSPNATNIDFLPYPALITGFDKPLALLVGFTIFLTIPTLVIYYRSLLEE